MRLIFLSFLFLTLALPAASTHVNAATSKSNKERLNDVQKRLNEQKATEKTLKTKVNTLKKDLKSIKKRLVKTARRVQDNERLLRDVNTRLQEMELEQMKLRQSLKNDQRSLSRLILALERIRRLPPQAMLVKPEAPFKTAQSAMLMRDIIPSLNKQAEGLKVKLKSLEDVTQNIQRQRRKLLNVGKTLKDEKSTLDSLISARETAYAKTNKNLEKQKIEIKKISKQAKTISDLVAKLESERKKQRTASRNARREARIPAQGPAQLPLLGTLKRRYNDLDNFGAKSKGIEIEGNAGALIVAPMGGVVRFAGFFKNYGNLVILEHKDGYHSLISGLEKINTGVGRSVSTGEPLGILHRSSNTNKPTLYYELRRNGRAVNPAKKFSSLS